MHLPYPTEDDLRHYHTQDTANFCGVACAMMIRSEPGIGQRLATLSQSTLNGKVVNDTDEWKAPSGTPLATDPSGLKSLLDGSKTFTPVKWGCEACATLAVIKRLYAGMASPAVVVYGRAHWNTVRGIQTDKSPTEAGYKLEGLWLNNPIFYDRGAASHYDGDDCGRGGWQGFDYEFVTYDEWRFHRFTGSKFKGNGCLYPYSQSCSAEAIGAATTGTSETQSPALTAETVNQTPGINDLQWVTVCEDILAEDTATDGIGTPQLEFEESVAASEASPCEKEKDIGVLAEKALEALGLKENAFAKSAFETGSFGWPRGKVRRYYREKEVVWLLPWFVDGSGVQAIAEVEVSRCRLRSVRILKSALAPSNFRDFMWDKVLNAWMDLDEGAARFTSLKGMTQEDLDEWGLKDEDFDGRKPIPQSAGFKLHGWFDDDEQDQEVSTKLIWMPCRESWSSALPFYPVKVGDKKHCILPGGNVVDKLNRGEGG